MKCRIFDPNLDFIIAFGTSLYQKEHCMQIIPKESFEIRVLNKMLRGLNDEDKIIGLHMMLKGKHINYKQLKENVVINNDYRKIIDLLYSSNFISNSHRADIEPMLVEHEKNIDRMKLVTPTINESQKDLIKFMVEEHMDDLFEAVKDNLTLVLENKDLDNAMESFLNILEINGIEDKKKIAELSESFKYVYRVYNGDSGLEDNFIKYGGTIPNLDIQQKIIRNFYRPKLDEMIETEKAKMDGASKQSIFSPKETKEHPSEEKSPDKEKKTKK